MKKFVAEYLKLIGAMGLVPGLKVALQKTIATADFPVQLEGINGKTWIRKGTSDWTAFKQVFVWKEYEYPIPFTPSTILDAGSNVGYAALWFLRKFPKSQIVSLEPEASNYDMLKKNTAPYSNVVPLKSGLWGRSCFLRIIPTGWGNWGFRTEEIEQETADSIKAVSVDEIMRTYNWQTIDLLKMDIEGAERNVFATNADDWLPKVKMIFLELHDNVYEDCSRNVFRALLNHNFRVDISGENLILINNSFKN